MTRTEGRTDEAPAPVGPYSQTVRIGALVAVAGQAGIDAATGVIVSDDVGAQTERALKNVELALAVSGASMDDVIRVDVFLASMSDFQDMNKAYAKAFRPPYPARTTVAVGLAIGLKVEIAVLAEIEARY